MVKEAVTIMENQSSSKSTVDSENRYGGALRVVILRPTSIKSVKQLVFLSNLCFSFQVWVI